MHIRLARLAPFSTCSPRNLSVSIRAGAALLLPGMLYSTLFLSACGSAPDTVEVSERREITQPVTPPTDMSETQRFGFDVAGAPSPSQAMEEAHQHATAPHYHWTTPPGWTEAAPTSLRLANLRVAGQDNAECYFTVLPGGGGGVEANVNRWRAQMGLDPMDSAAIADLPTATLLDMEAVYVELDGVYTGMRGEVNEPDFRMVGLIAEDAENAYFIKMTGPQELIADEMDAFQIFVDTLHAHHGSHGHAHTHDAYEPYGATETPADAQEAAAAPEADMELPMGHPTLDTGVTGAEDPNQVKWVAPEHWTRGADRAMRLVTYAMGESECYVTVLGGAGGGIEANVNRWRNQMDHPPLSEAEIAELPTIPMLDDEAVYVQITGDYGDHTGTAGPAQPDAMLLGAILLLEESSLFVLMIGPEAEVREEIDHFKDFCASFHW